MPFITHEQVTDLLKLHTRSAHISLEKKLVSFIRKINSTEDYTRLLRMMYGFYHPLEKKMEAAWNNELCEEEERRKSTWILEDLHNMGNGFHTPPLCALLPEISSPVEAMGVMYVMEGSTLGGIHIAAMISKQLLADAPASFRFLEGYGSETKNKWHAFCTLLNSHSYSTVEKDNLLNTANQTFLLFEKWVAEYESGTV